MNNIDIKYAKNWSEEEIILYLQNDNMSILTLVNADACKNIKIIKIFNFIELIKKFVKCQNQKDYKVDYNSIMRLYDYYNFYDPSLQIILNKKLVILFFENLKNINNITEKIGIISGGYSELNLVAIGFILCILHNINVYIAYDYGVNNIDLILNIKDILNNNKFNIVIGGMENCISHVVAVLTDNPIICVPSSVSYDKENSSLLSLFNNKTNGMIIFNINNIYGACLFSTKLFLQINKYVIEFNLKFDELCNIDQSHIDYLLNQDLIIMEDKIGVTTNLLCGILKKYNHEIPVIGFTNNIITAKIMLSGCMQYGVIMNTEINIESLRNRIKKLIIN
jgi:NCAIR mutase (PurE)-related protein